MSSTRRSFLGMLAVAPAALVVAGKAAAAPEFHTGGFVDNTEAVKLHNVQATVPASAVDTVCPECGYELLHVSVGFPAEVVKELCLNQCGRPRIIDIRIGDHIIDTWPVDLG